MMSKHVYSSIWGLSNFVVKELICPSDVTNDGWPYERVSFAGARKGLSCMGMWQIDNNRFGDLSQNDQLHKIVEVRFNKTPGAKHSDWNHSKIYIQLKPLKKCTRSNLEWTLRRYSPGQNVCLQNIKNWHITVKEKAFHASKTQRDFHHWELFLFAFPIGSRELVYLPANLP